MTVKQVSDYWQRSSSRNYIGNSGLSVRHAAKGFLLSLRASNRYAPSSLQSLESGLAFLAQYAEAQDWPGVQGLTTAHIEEYLAYLQIRPRWFEEISIRTDSGIAMR